jgi:hypothetical protein
MGATWSKHTPMPGKGCVKPRLLMLGGSGNSTTDSERTFLEKRTRNLSVTKDHHWSIVWSSDLYVYTL